MPSVISCAWISYLIIHQTFSLARDWSKHVTWPNIPRHLKLGNIREDSRIFKTARVAKKVSRIINTIASIWGENMLGYYLLLVADSFPRATLSENCLILGTDNVRGQISQHIFAPNGGYCLFMIHQIFLLARDWSKQVTWPNIPQFSKIRALRKRFEG